VSAPAGPLRVAVDAGNLVRDRRGMGRVTRGILRFALADANIEVTLLADKRQDVRALEEEFPGVRLREAASARKRRAYDVVWFPFNGMRYGVAAPALVTMYDAFAFTRPHRSGVARRREQAPMRRAAREAAAFVTGSNWSRDELVRTPGIDPRRTHVVAPAPDPYWFPALGDPAPEALAGQRFVLAAAGEPRKNVRLALAACARALRGPDEVLVLVGELMKADRTLARKLRLRSLEIAPGDAMLRSLYRNAAAVLVPSLAEGFGLVAVEAMACGAPVIAANASALPEATGGAALLLDVADPAPWAEAIRTLLDDPGTASAWRARAAGRFAFADRASPARAVLALLRELARGGAA
jgi:glycosyltransferase involved in cell wall biosynthesis